MIWADSYLEEIQSVYTGNKYCAQLHSEKIVFQMEENEVWE